MGLPHFGFGEARHEIALGDEAAVEREAITAGPVELLRAHAELDRGFGAALCAHHACGAAAGPVTERGRLEQDDVAHSAFCEQYGRPGAHRASANHHHVGMGGTGHSTRP